MTLTEHIAPSMLVAVTGPGVTGSLVGRVVAATGRPREDLDVLRAGGRPVVTSSSPSAASVVIPGRPALPGPGASSYQQAEYHKALSRWRGQLAAGQREVITRTAAQSAAWSRGLQLQAAAGSSPSPSATGLAAECALAVNAVTGLVDQAGQQFGARRVVLLAVASLAGMPPAGELNGDDVIVITSYLPTAPAASAAQENLLAAGATRAAILGPEVSADQIDQLVTGGLTEETTTETLSGRALFANNSSVLLSSAAGRLTPLVGPLRRPGASAVINGYASAPGSTQHNQELSQDRAGAVAAFLEARGVPSSCLLVVGHGATDFVAPGASSDNRRVVVVIEAPAPS
jgi:outer membrane protein OmpA-like peptidoglycan-associated protein